MRSWMKQSFPCCIDWESRLEGEGEEEEEEEEEEGGGGGGGEEHRSSTTV